MNEKADYSDLLGREKMKRKRITIGEDEKGGYIIIVINGFGATYEFETFKEAVEALPNLEELN